mmetsp:Transcript_32090/g.59110  ORF Transcript_32090/g.59110 Transcript_32090/m.59110 type:complete len:97 (+) Transcript_32090:691-981(+)
MKTQFLSAAMMAIPTMDNMMMQLCVITKRTQPLFTAIGVIPTMGTMGNTYIRIKQDQRRHNFHTKETFSEHTKYLRSVQETLFIVIKSTVLTARTH